MLLLLVHVLIKVRRSRQTSKHKLACVLCLRVGLVGGVVAPGVATPRLHGAAGYSAHPSCDRFGEESEGKVSRAVRGDEGALRKMGLAWNEGRAG
jgi:hypothetical protein